MVFPELFVPLLGWTPRLDPLYPCAWQTKFLSTTSQFATQRSFHVPLLKIPMDPLEGQPPVVRKLIRNSKKKKINVENIGKTGKFGGGDQNEDVRGYYDLTFS